jgi:hypothetical protein
MQMGSGLPPPPSVLDPDPPLALTATVCKSVKRKSQGADEIGRFVTEIYPLDGAFAFEMSD